MHSIFEYSYFLNICKYLFINIIILSVGTKFLLGDIMLFKKLSSFDVENETLGQYYENRHKNDTNSSPSVYKSGEETFGSRRIEKGGE